MSVRVQEADFDLGAEIAALRAGRPNIGAVASFIGTVRDINDGTGVSEMELEHYPGMTEKALADIVSAAMQRWELIDALVIHRVGKLKPQDQIVLVAVASKHRGESFCRVRIHHGLPQERGAVLEEGTDARRRALG
jgi:molybdopterin synthase catalytic subunit